MYVEYRRYCWTEHPNSSIERRMSQFQHNLPGRVMTRSQAFILFSIFTVCTGLISASYVVTGTPRASTSSTEVLAGFESLSDAISGTYSRDEEVRPKKRVADRPAKKRAACDPATQTCLASAKKPKVETVTYETGYSAVCVRLCDGYYFPISSVSSPQKFEANSLDCQSRCASPARLYVYKNTGGSPETMVDLEGRPYSELKTAFVHRASHNAACTCKADPWTEEAANKHRIYALEEADRNGDAEAATKLALMRSIVRRQVSEARIRSGAAELKPVLEGDLAPVSPEQSRDAVASAAPVLRTVTDRATPVVNERPIAKFKRKANRPSASLSRKSRRAYANDRYMAMVRREASLYYARSSYRYAAYRGW